MSNNLIYTQEQFFKIVINGIRRIAKEKQISEWEVKLIDLMRLDVRINQRQIRNFFTSFSNFRRKYLDPKDLSVPLIEEYEQKKEQKDHKKDISSIVKNNSFYTELEQVAKDLLHPNMEKICPVFKLKQQDKKTQRILTLLLTDLHFGADIDPAETGGVAYGREEEAKYFAKIIYETCQYKVDHRPETELQIFLGGDIIENQLHDARTGATMSEQVNRAIFLLTQGFYHLAQHFKKVTIHAVPGNHDRNIQRHPERAVHQKWDSYGYIIYHSVKLALAHIKNLDFRIPRIPIARWKIFDYNFAGTHSDTVFNVGKVYSSVNVKTIQNNLNSLNIDLPKDEKIDLLLIGHLHFGFVMRLNSGAVVICNPGLPAVDPYSVSQGRLKVFSGQTIFESVPKHFFGDFRQIEVNPHTIMNDTNLDFIKPWRHDDELANARS